MNPLKRPSWVVAMDMAIREGLLKSLPKITMEINEMFYSLQGETRDAGCPTVFIRTQFCPLRCSYCDTKDSWLKGKGREASLQEIVDYTNMYPHAKICITGGEPLKQMDAILILCAVLRLKGRYVTVETAGQEPIERISKLVNSVVMDWKSPTSGMRKMMNEGNLLILSPKDQLKFVVGTRADLEDVEKTLARMVEIAPQGYSNFPEILIGAIEGDVDLKLVSEADERISPQKVFEWAMNTGKQGIFNIRFQIQLHKHIYGDKRGV